MEEIGGYFGLEQLPSKEYYPNLIAINSGRFALLYVLKARKIKKLYIPYFLCDSISELCNRYGYEYEFYHIKESLLPDFDKELQKQEYLYVVNYYGQISNQQLSKLVNRYKNVIFDNVQAFYQPPIDGVDTIYSCRKFFGVPDGAYLATDTLLEEMLEEDVSGKRMKHILGRFEGMASEYYRDFRKSDEAYSNDKLKTMSRLTHNLLGAIDYEYVRKIRNLNYAFLAQHLDERNLMKLKSADGSYCYPFYCENGMEIKKKLAMEKIYVPTLWPNVLECREYGLEKELAENILPLPVDQRYGKNEMERIIKEVWKCLS